MNTVRKPKLFEITYEFFYQPGGEGHLDSEWCVFATKRAAQKYAKQFVREENDGVDERDELAVVRFVDVKEVTEVDGYEIKVGRRSSSSHP